MVALPGGAAAPRRLLAAAAAAGAALGVARVAHAFDLPDMKLPDLPDMDDLANRASEHLPSMSSLTPDEMSLHSVDDDADTTTCSSEVLGMYPSGWPAKLDWGIYWFGPGGQFKKAKASQQVKLLNPSSWVRQDDGYANSTERWNAEFYDPSRNTVIFFHGWSGTSSWFPQRCQRLTTMCGRQLCPRGKGEQGKEEEEFSIDLAADWIRAGWNVGFFYWDQFADEPCMRDAEQKLWFDRKGNGLRWASYVPGNGSTWRHYLGEPMTVSEMCVAAVRDAMGDFYSGGTVRFVGYSIGAQLAASCAAKLHQEQHVAAPQRMALLQPFFTQKDWSFMGLGIRCGKFTSDPGISGFVAASTVSYVRQLWVQSRVVTEIYSSTEPNAEGQMGAANADLQAHAAVAIYKPLWCDAGADPKCVHTATVPLYFLGLGSGPPRLAGQQRPPDADSGRRASAVNGTGANATTASGAAAAAAAGAAATAAGDGTVVYDCMVPSAACTDAQLRALIERAARPAAATAAAGGQRQREAAHEVWRQVQGRSTLTTADDVFELFAAPHPAGGGGAPAAAAASSAGAAGAAGAPALRAAAPRGAAGVEEEILESPVLAKREWGMHRSLSLGLTAGISPVQLHAGLMALAALVAVPLVGWGLWAAGRRAAGLSSRDDETTDVDEDSSRALRSEDGEDEDEDEDEDEEEACE